MNCLESSSAKPGDCDHIIANNVCDENIAQALALAIQSGCTDKILEVLDWVKDHNLFQAILKLH